MNASSEYAALPGVLIYALSDIHGRSDMLRQLLATIEADARGIDCERRVLVFLGDYVDRGPDSRGVVETLTGGLPEGFESICLMGNHEEMLLDFADHGRNLDHWLDNGAETTLGSYGIDVFGRAWTRPEPDAARAEFLAAMPQAHRSFFSGLGLSHVEGGYFFAHAGVRPGVPLDAQDRHDLLWIRREFLHSDADFGKLVVHGHTPGELPVTRPNRICIDTGAWFSGRLTALRLWGEDRGFIDTA